MNISSKILVIAGLLVLMASLAVPTFAKEVETDVATTNVTLTAIEGRAHAGDLIMSPQDDDDNDSVLVGRYHDGKLVGYYLMDRETYDMIVSWILARGGIPSDENVDEVFRSMGGGR